MRISSTVVGMIGVAFLVFITTNIATRYWLYATNLDGGIYAASRMCPGVGRVDTRPAPWADIATARAGELLPTIANVQNGPDINFDLDADARDASVCVWAKNSVK